MKFLNDYWQLILAALAALISGGLLAWPMLRRGGAALSPAMAVQLINREKAVLIDVRDAEEFAKGHAAGARNLPLATLEGEKSLPKNKTLPIVLMCGTGARAQRAAGILHKLGYEKAQALAGGFPAWRDANLPVEKS